MAWPPEALIPFDPMNNDSKLRLSFNASATDQMAQSMPNGMGYTKKMVETKTFMKDDAKLTKTYDMRLRKTEIQPNEPVYIYAGQKNNWY